MMWEKFSAQIRLLGSDVELGQKVVRLQHINDAVQTVSVKSVTSGLITTVSVSQVISTMALSHLVFALSPSPPASVLNSARALKYRDFLIVVLILDATDLFEDNWIYVHSAAVKVGRIQNFKAWSTSMVPDASMASIGMEYFCNDDDCIWSMDDNALIEMAKIELESIGLASSCDCIDGTVLRQTGAYPVYDADYQKHVKIIQKYLQRFSNLQTVGRNGLHRYNNQDHSMVTAIMAAKNVLNQDQSVAGDVWSVNVERSYQEQIRVVQPGTDTSL